MNSLRNELMSGPLYRFADWPKPDVPNWRSGVYTIWDSEDLIYLGIAVRGLVPGVHQTDVAQANTKPKGLRDRLASHASGRRSGDQFNIYVFDRLVLPTLSAAEIESAAAGELSLDAATKLYIREKLAYRFVVTEDGASAYALERDVQRGAVQGKRPLFNPLR